MNFYYLYEVFDIEKIIEVRSIEPLITNLSLNEDSEASIENIVEENPPDDPEYQPDEDDQSVSSGEFELVLVPKHSRNFNIENICAVSDRRNVSLRDTALIVSTTLQELGIVNKTKHR